MTKFQKYYRRNRERLLKAVQKYQRKNRKKILAAKKKYYRKNKAKIQIYRVSYNKRTLPQRRIRSRKERYGVSNEWFESQAKLGCAICGRKKHKNRRALHVDHCHKSNINRGVLCSNCNTMLGLAHDDANILTVAAQYLKNHA